MEAVVRNFVADLGKQEVAGSFVAGLEKRVVAGKRCVSRSSGLDSVAALAVEWIVVWGAASSAVVLEEV